MVKLVWNNWKRWLAIGFGGQPAPGQVQVFYGHDHIPGPGEPVHGGMVKFQRMQAVYPNAPHCYHIIYMVSSAMPQDWKQLQWLSHRKGARLVWNQNGTFYQGWYGAGWEKQNVPMSQMLHRADYVFYQSQFCKQSADLFLGEKQGPSEILYNAVDTATFAPAKTDPDPQHLVLLLGGSQYQWYRLETALRTLALLVQQRSDVQLLVTGRLRWTSNEQEVTRMVRDMIDELDIADRVTFLGMYAQKDAVAIFRRAHVLLHTQYNDASPGLVIEAMACGLPVVYSKSGGTPELVGDEAGIGVHALLSWEQIHPPDPSALAEAVLKVAENRRIYAEAARQRMVEQFDLRQWVQRHREVFESLVCVGR
jgi:glycosyltransferase involved in cell wall biosynthesis